MVRSLLALLAVAVIAWVGVLLRDFAIGHDASERAFNPRLSRPQRERNLERVKDAQFLDPSSEWRLSRAGYYLLAGRGDDAERLAEQLVRDEPDNIGAWGVLLEATTKRDPRRAAQALAQLKRLDPLGHR